MSVLLGNGDGTFAAAVNRAVGATPQALVAADFNGDGRTDLAVANTGASTVTILLRTAAGSFTTATVSVGSTGPCAIAAADWNNDGDIDLAVTVVPLSGIGGGTLNTLTNSGAGAFTKTQSVMFYGSAAGSASVVPLYLIAGDFNSDGKADLAYTTLTDSILSTIDGKGDDTVGSPSGTYGLVDRGAAGLAVADFDGDGRPARFERQRFR